MIAAADITGVVALPPSPFRAGADPFGIDHTLDLEEAARVADQLICDGVSAIGLCGTTGECATLTWAEKELLYSTVRDAAAGRVAIYAGATALGTREVVEQMRRISDMGIDGAFVGLPLWQTPTVEEAVRFYEDLSKAVPDLAVLVYANSFFFKFDYPLAFWQGIAARCPTVVACKVGFGFTKEIYDAAGHQVNFLHGEGGGVSNTYKKIPESVTAAWATSCAMGPEPWVAALKAINSGDRTRALEVLGDIDTVPLALPDFADFPKFNLQFEKARINAAGYMQCGPPRPPYTELPDDWREAAEHNGRGWAQLRSRYVAVGRS